MVSKETFVPTKIDVEIAQVREAIQAYESLVETLESQQTHDDVKDFKSYTESVKRILEQHTKRLATLLGNRTEIEKLASVLTLLEDPVSRKSIQGVDTQIALTKAKIAALREPENEFIKTHPLYQHFRDYAVLSSSSSRYSPETKERIKDTIAEEIAKILWPE